MPPRKRKNESDIVAPVAKKPTVAKASPATASAAQQFVYVTSFQDSDNHHGTTHTGGIYHDKEAANLAVMKYRRKQYLQYNLDEAEQPVKIDFDEDQLICVKGCLTEELPFEWKVTKVQIQTQSATQAETDKIIKEFVKAGARASDRNKPVKRKEAGDRPHSEESEPDYSSNQDEDDNYSFVF